MERKTSAAFLEEEAEATVESSESTLTESESVPIGGPRTNKQIRLTAGRLAELQNYFAPPEKPVDSAVSRHASFIVVAGQTKADDILNNDIGVGGARIFMTALIDDKDNRLTSVLGGEEVRLRVCVAAEEFVEKPIVGFQIKNDRGLTLIADNSYVATKNSDMSLEAGDVITVDFCFRMPLVSKGDYVVRVGFANGAENNNALLDVQHEALLLTCVSSGMRHGLVGIPMLGIEVNRKLASSFDETKKT
jgi:lipopolysaccharide transport system ATP-binding protein